MSNEVYFHEEEQHHKGIQKYSDNLWEEEPVERLTIKVECETRFDPELKIENPVKVIKADCEAVLKLEDALEVIKWTYDYTCLMGMRCEYVRTLWDAELEQVLWYILRKHLRETPIPSKYLTLFMYSLGGSAKLNFCAEIFKACEENGELNALVESIYDYYWAAPEGVYEELYSRNLLPLSQYNQEHYLEYVLNNLDDDEIYTKENYILYHVEGNRVIISKLVEKNRELAMELVSGDSLPHRVENVYREILGLEQISEQEYNDKVNKILPF